jgi:hypothetical protein
MGQLGKAAEPQRSSYCERKCKGGPCMFMVANRPMAYLKSQKAPCCVCGCQGSWYTRSRKEVRGMFRIAKKAHRVFKKRRSLCCEWEAKRVRNMLEVTKKPVLCWDHRCSRNETALRSRRGYCVGNRPWPQSGVL